MSASRAVPSDTVYQHDMLSETDDVYHVVSYDAFMQSFVPGRDDLGPNALTRASQIFKSEIMTLKLGSCKEKLLYPPLVRVYVFV